jgi:hypothetical protein
MKNKIFFCVFCVIILISLYLALAENKEGHVFEGYTVGDVDGKIEGVTSVCKVGDTDYNNTNICYNIRYIKSDSSISSVKARIDPNYYIDSNRMLKMVPYGYVVSFDKLSYSPKTQSGAYEQANNKVHNDALDVEIARFKNMTDADYTTYYNENTGKQLIMFTSKEKQIEYLEKQKINVIDDDKTSNKAYNSDNTDITYHTDPEINSDESTAGVGKMWVKDKDGTLISIPYSDAKNTTLYYETGSYPFGPSSYVPNYEESTLLSKYSNKITKDSNIYETASQKSGFCEATKSSIYEREQKCNQIDNDMCASTDCCVLLGGEKCVAGNQNGPSIKANYSDFLIVNRDYYYYKGKCYGNCS